MQYRADLQEFMNAAVKPEITYDKPDYKKMPPEEKIKLCSRTSGIFAISKLVNGDIKYTPRNCNHCEACYEANALKLESRIHGLTVSAENKKEGGQWRMKIVNEDVEAQSLKKHIERNQNGMRFEIACSEAGKSEVWSYVIDEPGKDMQDVYGILADPNNIDFTDLYQRNRITGKKLSVGSAFKTKLADGKKDTIRLVIPEILVKDVNQQKQAARIIEDTNYLEIADDAERAAHLFLLQFEFILKELEAANIKVAATLLTYYNMNKETVLEDWNNKTTRWMSINSSKGSNDLGINLDISHLIYPETTQPVLK